MPPTPQQEFRERYVTSTEICAELGLTRSALILARRAGRLPEPISVRGAGGQVLVMIWRRADVEGLVRSWREALDARRGCEA